VHNILWGGRWWLPQVWALMNLVSPSYLWLILSPNVFKLCTNHLVLILCMFMWVVEACQFFLVPSQSSSTPSTPPKCCDPGNVFRLLTLSLFPIWIHIWVPQRVGNASTLIVLGALVENKLYLNPTNIQRYMFHLIEKNF
jgi:hypothetical protein